MDDACSHARVSRSRRARGWVWVAAGIALGAASAHAADGAPAAAPWWFGSAALFVVCFGLGLLAVPAGIGGGTLFVPIVGSMFSFHLDFVRGAGLLVALGSALSAAPMLLRSGLGSLRLTLPLAVLASASSIAGAALGLALPAQTVQVLLGLVVLAIVALMLAAKGSEHPPEGQRDRLAQALALRGSFVDHGVGRGVPWRVRRTVPGLLSFMGIGALGGLFGIGAGWANVPVLNLLMGAPLKLAVGTSGILLTLVSSPAAWVYLHRGAVVPLIAVPSVAGTMLGAHFGARLLDRMPGSSVRLLVLGMLSFAGARALLKGTGVWP